MQLQRKDVEFCLNVAVDVSDHYGHFALVPTHPKRSIDALRRVISEYLGKKFVVRKVRFLRGVIHALYLATDADTYEIYVLEGLDENELRFALCKELFHVALDQIECRNLNIYEHLEEVITVFPVVNGEPNCPAAWEILAEAAAMEFLMPIADREALIARGTPDFSVASARYGIPQQFIEKYCSEFNMQSFRECHKSRVGG